MSKQLTNTKVIRIKKVWRYGWNFEFGNHDFRNTFLKKESVLEHVLLKFWDQNATWIINRDTMKSSNVSICERTTIVLGCLSTQICHEHKGSSGDIFPSTPYHLILAWPQCSYHYIYPHPIRECHFHSHLSTAVLQTITWVSVPSA